MNVRTLEYTFRMLVVIALAFSIAGCDVFGSSESDGPLEEDPPEEEVQDDPEETLDARQMATTMQNIDERVSAIMPPAGTSADERDHQQELADVARELEELAGVDTVAVHREFLSATVVLENGLPIMISNNRPSADPTSSGAGTAAESRALIDSLRAKSKDRASAGEARTTRAVPRAKAEAPPVTLPGSNEAVVVSIDGGDRQASKVESLLSNAGYQVADLGGSLEDMRQYQDIGVLYLDTHGAAFIPVEAVDEEEGPSWGDLRYALQTTTRAEASAVWIEAHEDELLAGDVVLARYNDDTFKVAITESFIAEHWDLADGFAMIHACYFGAGFFTVDGVTFDSTPMQQAILESAQALVSFDNYTLASYAQASIYYTFRMLLGRGSAMDRAWDLGTTRAALEEMGHTRFDKPDWAFGPITWGGNTVNVTFHGTERITLAPSLRGIDVIDDAARQEGWLEMHGRFGTERGKVFVGTTELPVVEWKPEKVVARSPFSGDGSSGWVRVETPESLPSNGVNLTRWSGQLVGMADNDQGSLLGETALLLRFRADVHPRRDGPLEYLEFPERVETYISPTSTGTIVGSGSYRDNDPDLDITATWTGENSFRLLTKSEIDNGGPPAETGKMMEDGHALKYDSFFGGKATLRPGANEAELCLRMYGKFTEEYTYHHASGPVTESWEIGFAFMKDLREHNDAYTDVSGLTCVPLQMADLPDMTMPSRFLSVDQGGGTIQVGWTDLNARNTPR